LGQVSKNLYSIFCFVKIWCKF